jgi:Holliday junction resolvase RusA-like endonuclease
MLKNGKPIAMSYKTTEASKYQKEFIKYVKEQVKLQGWVKSDNKFQHYYMDTYFYFPRTDMDANNYYKCLADAITDSEVVWIDDTQLCERVQSIFYDSQNPNTFRFCYRISKTFKIIISIHIYPWKVKFTIHIIMLILII